jgi:hypothetical protein
LLNSIVLSNKVFASINISLSIADGIETVIIVVSSHGHMVSELARFAEWARLLDHVSGGTSDRI